MTHPAGSAGVQRRIQGFLRALATGGGKPIEQMTPPEARAVLEGLQSSVKVDLPRVDVAERTISSEGQTAEFESPAPLEVFSALQLSLPARTSDECTETVDAKVMAIEEGRGARRTVVRFTGVDWSAAAPIETEARAAR